MPYYSDYNDDINDDYIECYDVYDGLIYEFDLTEKTCCLIDNETDEDVPTFIKEFDYPFEELSDYNKTTGWFIDWTDFPKDCRIFGLYIDVFDEYGEVIGEEIEGLIAIGTKIEFECWEVKWICSAPWNRSHKTGGTGEKRYYGVGYHLFRIACDFSKAQGLNGGIWGLAANRSVLEHYQNTVGAQDRSAFHPDRKLFFTVPGYFLTENTEECTYNAKGVEF